MYGIEFEESAFYQRTGVGLFRLRPGQEKFVFVFYFAFGEFALFGSFGFATQYSFIFINYFLLTVKESSKEKPPEMITFGWPYARYTGLEGATVQPTSSHHFRIASAPLGRLFLFARFRTALAPVGR